MPTPLSSRGPTCRAVAIRWIWCSSLFITPLAPSYLKRGECRVAMESRLLRRPDHIGTSRKDRGGRDSIGARRDRGKGQIWTCDYEGSSAAVLGDLVVWRSYETASLPTAPRSDKRSRHREARLFGRVDPVGLSCHCERSVAIPGERLDSAINPSTASHLKMGDLGCGGGVVVLPQ